MSCHLATCIPEIVAETPKSISFAAGRGAHRPRRKLCSPLFPAFKPLGTPDVASLCAHGFPHDRFGSLSTDSAGALTSASARKRRPACIHSAMGWLRVMSPHPGSIETGICRLDSRFSLAEFPQAGEGAQSPCSADHLITLQLRARAKCASAARSSTVNGRLRLPVKLHAWANRLFQSFR